MSGITNDYMIEVLDGIKVNDPALLNLTRYVALRFRTFGQISSSPLAPICDRISPHQPAIVNSRSSIEMSVSAVLREYLFGVNLEAARYFTQKAWTVQTRDAKLTHEERSHLELQSFTSASILHSTGFMEAMINEFLMDVIENQHPNGAAVDGKVAERIKVVWHQSLRGNASILPKYQICLSVFDKPVFNQGAQPYQGAATVVKLRNSLVHHAPESTEIVLGDVNEETPQALVKILSPYVKTNPWHDGATTSSLNRVLWAGAAEWALNASLALVNEFFSRIGRTPPYQRILEQWAEADAAHPA